MDRWESRPKLERAPPRSRSTTRVRSYERLVRRSGRDRVSGARLTRMADLAMAELAWSPQVGTEAKFSSVTGLLWSRFARTFLGLWRVPSPRGREDVDFAVVTAYTVAHVRPV